MQRDIEHVLDLLMVDVAHLRGGNYLCHCPFHDDNNPSFAVHDETGAWICYSGCGQGNLTELVMRQLNTNRRDALHWLDKLPPVDDPDAPAMPLWSDPPIEHIGPPEYHYVEGTTHRMMLDRGFTKETLAQFRIGWDKIKQAVVIPVYWKGAQAGLIYRHVPPIPDDWPKYEYTPHLPKSEILFGYEHVRAYPEAGRPFSLILVEGPLDCMWLHQCGFNSAVAILGMHLSKKQAAEIKKVAYDVTLCFDSDAAGRAATKHAESLLKGSCYLRHAILPPERKDIAECSLEEVQEVVESTLIAAPLPKKS